MTRNARPLPPVPGDVTVFLPLPEAALRLGVSQSALRRRVRAGTTQGERRPSAGGYTWWVGVPDDTPTPGEPARTPEPTPSEPTPSPQATPGVGVSAAEFAASQEAVRRLEAHVASLTDEVTARRREVAELHVTMNRLLLALPAPALAEATSTNGRTHEDAAPTPGRRSWWQRILAWG